MLVLQSIRSFISCSLIVLFVFAQLMPLVMNICIQQHYAAKLFQNKKQVQLQFSAKEWASFRLVKKNEVIIHGKMFDVKTVALIEDQVFVTGHYDTKEDKLVKLEKETKRKGIAIEKQLSFFTALFFEEHENYNFFKQYISQKYYATKTTQFSDKHILADIPPPKFA